jgi:hypothetical protein
MIRKAGLATTVVGFIAATATSAFGADLQQRLLLVGPVESVDVARNAVTVLGHRIALVSIGRLTAGHVVSVYGRGTALGYSAVSDSGVFASGAETVLLSGTVTSVHSATGTFYVDGALVSATSLFGAQGFELPSLGAHVTVSGTQPQLGGAVLASSVKSGLGVSNGGIEASSGVSNGGYQASRGVSNGGYEASSGVSNGGYQASLGVSNGGYQASRAVSKA